MICILVIMIIAFIVLVCWLVFGQKKDDGQTISLNVKSVSRSPKGDLTFHAETEPMPFSECPVLNHERSTTNGLDMNFFTRLTREDLPPQERNEMIKKLIDAGIVESSLIKMDEEVNVKPGVTEVALVDEPSMEEGDTEAVEDGSKGLDGGVNPFAGDSSWDDDEESFN